MKTWISLLLLAASLTLGHSAQAITTTEGDTLLSIKQEEKLARDVYQFLHQKWGVRIFLKIGQAEQQHMNAVSSLIVRYRLTDTTPSEPGKFSLPRFQALYDALVLQGSLSLEEAFLVGEVIETTDIDDLQGLLDATKEAPILRVLGNLQAASYTHLAAFSRQLE